MPLCRRRRNDEWMDGEKGRGKKAWELDKFAEFEWGRKWKAGKGGK